LTPDLRTYATTKVAYGLWQVKPECAGKITDPTVSDSRFASVPGSQRPAWMDFVGQSSLSPDAPVYMMSPGASLFRHICINCHGPKADGHGLQGDALSASSEGRARPANLAGGLFGPPEMLHQNLLNTFGLGTQDPNVADLWGSRYMAWMTLGGTLQLIPSDVMNQVQATKIFGLGRQNLSKLPLVDTVSANMLNLAKSLCAVVLPDLATPGGVRLTPGTITGDGTKAQDGPYFLGQSADSPFLLANGDWEMWMHLCGSFNRQVVRVYRVSKDNFGRDQAALSALYYADDGTANPPYRFPADGWVWDHNQNLRKNGVTPDNYYPACLKAPKDFLPREELAFSSPIPDDDAAFLQFRSGASVMPICPSDFIKHGELVMWSDIQTTPEQIENLRKWSLAGAINAGMSVFSYLEAADLSHNTIQPYYNECQLLPKLAGSP
jgi:hypothetical protein